MKFTISIELGNDAMDKPVHVARALESVAKLLVHTTFIRPVGGVIKDVNGNRVGM